LHVVVLGIDAHIDNTDTGRARIAFPIRAHSLPDEVGGKDRRVGTRVQRSNYCKTPIALSYPKLPQFCDQQ
jgi:hypothetical protein